MSDQNAGGASAPAHLWLVGLVALVWNAMGCFNYVMVMTRNEEFLETVSDEQLAWFDAQPAWATATWAIAVWGALLASLLLLLRKRAATPLYLISLLGVAATWVANYALSDGWDVIQSNEETAMMNTVFIVAVPLVALLLWRYASGQCSKGVLR